MSIKRLYRLLVGALVIGTILPAITIILKLSADDFNGWNEVSKNNELVIHLIDRFDFLNLSNYKFLAEISWHEAGSRNILKYYIRYSIFNVSLLTLVLIFKRFIKNWIGLYISWLTAISKPAVYRIVVFATIFPVVIFLTKMHLGYFFFGISGWDYRAYSSQMVPNVIVTKKIPNELVFLNQAILYENAKYQINEGQITGSAMFLHYENGQVLPANYELLQLVFPRYVFGADYSEVKNIDLFADIVTNSLKLRGKNRNFLLPLSISYPNHAPYMKIDYTNHPKAEFLQLITLWELTLSINNSSVELKNYNKKFEIKVNNDEF